jgi:hypothetical protein
MCVSQNATIGSCHESGLLKDVSRYQYLCIATSVGNKFSALLWETTGTSINEFGINGPRDTLWEGFVLHKRPAVFISSIRTIQINFSSHDSNFKPNKSKVYVYYTRVQSFVRLFDF